jgi:predicted deacylase
VNGFRFLDQVIARGTITRLYLLTSESFAGSRVETPIVVIHGQQHGPKICIVAGIHGDEVNGVEVVRRAVASVSPASLRGTVIAVPIANLSAFRRGSRYLPDRRDLNRYFPGRLLGSSASRIAFGLFSQVIQHCEAVIDLHTGSFHRTNLHQLRADLSDPATVQLAADFGAAFVVNSAAREGTLRRASTDEGIPAITVEAGQPTLFDEGQVLEALAGILRLLRARGMIETPEAPPISESPMAFLGTRWVRADQGGVLVSRVELGQQVQAGQMLGTISDPLSDEVEAVIAPVSGRLLGMALDQVVMPGFAAYHIGFEARPFDRMIVAPTTRQNVREVTEAEGLDLEERPE